MFERRFAKQSGMVTLHARNVAKELGSPVVEAEHFLLALTGPAAGPARAVLEDAGLDRDAVQAALDGERDKSLAAVGVSADSFDLPDKPAPYPRTPGWGTSGKAVLERASKEAVGRGEKSIKPAHILLGVLRAEAGTVPRTLEVAGVDRKQLVKTIHDKLDAAA
jgi:ATP-dependent Clp protease ATP-binding subunit ClpA